MFVWIQFYISIFTLNFSPIKIVILLNINISDPFGMSADAVVMKNAV